MSIILTEEKKQIPLRTYPMDHFISIRDRVVFALNSLPEYVDISSIEVLPTQETPIQIETINRWSVAKTASFQDMTPSDQDMTPSDQDMTPSDQDMTPSDQYLWALYHPSSPEGKDILKDVTDPSRALEELRTKRRTFKKEQQKLSLLFSNLSNIPPVQSSPFFEEFNIQKLVFSYPYSLILLFDELQVSSDIPLIVFGEYFKVLHPSPPSLKMNVENIIRTDESIFIKLSSNRSEKYSTISLTREEEGGFAIQLHSLDKTILQTQDILNNIITKIPKVTVQSYETLEVGGYIMIPQIIDLNIFGYLLMTYSTLPSFLSFNDNSKHVPPSGSRYLFFKYRDTYVTSIVSTRLAKATPTAIYPINTPYTHIQIIRSSSLEAIQLFRSMMNYIVGLYIQKAPSIDTFFKTFQLKEIIVLPKPKKMFRKELVPEVFSKRYSRQCQKDRYPSLLDEKQIETLQEENGEWVFPLNNQTKRRAIPFPTPNTTPYDTRWYYCTDPEYPNIGLISNVDNPFGYAPCCFGPRDIEKNEANEKYNQYLKGEVVTKRQQYFKRTDKIITLYNFGYFSKGHTPWLLRFFQGSQKQVVVRMGVQRGPNAVLECIGMALGLEPLLQGSAKDYALENQKREEYLQLLRKDIADTIPPVFSKQQMYTSSLDEITTYLRGTEYLDVLKVSRILEEFFKCNLFVFIKNKEFPNGTLTLPNHSSGWFREAFDLQRPSIFLYTHMGSESDQLKYPHCELLIHSDTDTVNKLRKPAYIRQEIRQLAIFPVKHILFQKTMLLFKTISTPYMGARKVSPLQRDIKNKMQLQEQIIDSRGKVRAFKLNSGNIVYTSPLPPIDLPTSTENASVKASLQFTDEKIATQWMETHCEDITQSPHSIQGSFKNQFTCTIYINPPNNISNENNSFNTTYNVSLYCMNWCFYLFSNWMNTDQLITEKDMETFFSTYFMIDQTFQYKPIGPLFGDTIPEGISRNNQIVCNTNEFLKRIVYQLRLTLKRDKPFIETFKNRLELDQYYNDILDFKTRPNEIIVTDLNKLDNPEIHVFYENIPKDKNTFFFKHDSVIDGTMCITYGYQTIEQALAHSAFYIQKGYNPSPTELQVITPVQEYILFVLKDGISTKYNSPLLQNFPKAYVIVSSNTPNTFFALMPFFNK